MAGRIAYYGNIATQGLVLNLDAAIQGSYPKTGSTWFDISNNRNNGTLTNGPLYTGSNYGAIVLDGVNDYIDIPGTSGYNLLPLSVEGWVSFPNGGSMEIINKYSVGSVNGFRFYADTTGINIYYFAGSLNNNALTNYDVKSGLIATGSFSTYAACTINTAGAVLYINGSPVGTRTWVGTPTIPTTTNTLKIGLYPGGGTSYYTNGLINNVKLYNQALSQFQVWQNFNAYKSRYGIPDIVIDGLVLNLDAGNPYSYLSGSSGTTWTNTVAVSSSISGALVNGPVYSNGAITFDGVDDYIGTNYTPSTYINTTQIIWYKWDGVNQFKVFSYLGNSNTNGIGFLLHDGSVGNAGSRVGVLYGGTYYNALNTGSLYAQLVSNQWCQLAITRDSSTTILYQNGNLIGSTSRTPNTPNPYRFSYGDFAIGAAGNVSNMMFYTRALTQAEITQNFNALRGRYGI